MVSSKSHVKFSPSNSFCLVEDALLARDTGTFICDFPFQFILFGGQGVYTDMEGRGVDLGEDYGCAF